jgi:predicted amidohydrolase YtcJ
MRSALAGVRIPTTRLCAQVLDTGASTLEFHRIRILRTTLVSFLCVGCSTRLVSGQDTATAITVFVAKKIVTMDPGWPSATAVAVRDGKILSVGSLEDLQPWLQGAPHRIDRRFADQVIVPGFIEPHGHPVLGGTSLTRPLLTYLPVPNPYGPPFPGVKNQAEATAKLREYVSKAGAPDETILSWGYDLIAMGGKHLDKEMLDKVSATQPLLVWDASAHFVYANSGAIRKYKITREDTRTKGIIAGADGEPNGQFLGINAAKRILAEPLEALLRPEVALKNVYYLMDLSRQNGITTTSELAFGAISLPLEQAVFDRYFNDPSNPMRCVVVTDATAAKAAKGRDAIAFVKELASHHTDKLVFNGVKFFADDSFLSLGMVMDNPGYTDGREGLFIEEPGKMVEAWRPWWEAGFQIHVHTNGNGGNRATLNALDGLMKLKPRFDHRFTLTHYGMSTPEMARRLARLGGLASVNPYYVYARSEFNAPFVGSDRAYTAARLKTLVNEGVPTSLHADTPVAPPFPLEEVWIAVNRFGLSGQARGPEERVNVHQALRMITIDAAYTLGVEDRVGSIASGKFADFAVLDQDPHDVPKEKIRDIKIWGTVFGGKVFPASEIRPR